MRFDNNVYFQKVELAFDATTGNSKERVVSEVKRYASITSAGIQSLNIVYGQIKEGSLVIRLQNEYNDSFDYICVGEKRYKADFSRPLRTKNTFIVSEVQDGT